MQYTQLTDSNVQEMLQAIPARSVDDLFKTIPERFRMTGDLNIPSGLSELEILRDTATLAAKNSHCEQLACFLGAGAYDHFVPTVVDHMAAQGAFLTGYTPYQAEASQGVLQLFFEFQTMVCQLTGMDAANASLYEVATAASEAVVMATAVTRRNRVVVSGSLHPDTLSVLNTTARSRGIELVVVATPGGVTEMDELRGHLSDKTAAVVVASPNFFGCVERIDLITPVVHEHGALMIVSTDPIASGLLKPPGAFDVDIVVAEGQALGVPLQYGGPYLGLMAGKEKLLRKMPGRIVGMARDAERRRGFCLVLQTREQHIKRERATSNICTNQGLLAVRAAIHMAALGPKGLADVASQCFDKAHYAASEITKLDGYELRFDAPFFKEFTVRTTRGVSEALSACRRADILGGVPLARLDDRYEDCFLVAVTEKRTRAEIDRLAEALDGV